MTITPQEREVLIALGLAWKKFGEMQDIGEGERHEFARLMNNANNLVLARGAARELRAERKEP